MNKPEETEETDIEAQRNAFLAYSTALLTAILI